MFKQSFRGQHDHGLRAVLEACYRDSLRSLVPPCDWGLQSGVGADDQVETLRQWTLACNLQRHWTWKPFYAAVLLDLGSVLNSLSGSEMKNLLFDLTHEDFDGVGIFVCTRGMKRWRSLLEDVNLRSFTDGLDGVIVNEYLVRPEWESSLMHVASSESAPPHFLFVLNGDKGDCASLLNMPALLFDDRMSNLVDVWRKGCRGSHGLLVETTANRHEAWQWRTSTCEVEAWSAKVRQWLSSLAF